MFSLNFFQKRFAPRKRLFRWWRLGFLIGLVLMLGSLYFALKTNDVSAEAGHYNIFVTGGNFEDWKYTVTKNFLVLGIHFGACLIGAIIGRSQRDAKIPKEERTPGKSYWNDLPDWIIKLTLIYAWIVTLSSIYLQAEKSGEIIADLAAYLNASPILVVVAFFPHALLELSAVFLPLGLFLLEARLQKLHHIGWWSIQSLLLAIPLVLFAATIEILFTPHLFEWVFHISEISSPTL